MTIHKNVFEIFFNWGLKNVISYFDRHTGNTLQHDCGHDKKKNIHETGILYFINITV